MTVDTNIYTLTYCIHKQRLKVECIKIYERKSEKNTQIKLQMSTFQQQKYQHFILVIHHYEVLPLVQIGVGD